MYFNFNKKAQRKYSIFKFKLRIIGSLLHLQVKDSSSQSFVGDKG